MGGDVDELIVLDPLVGDNPVKHIQQRTSEEVITPFAIEVVHRVDLEPALDASRPVLEQRIHGRANAVYCKPCIIRKPIRWSLGQHYSDYPHLNLSSELFLFHLRFFDRDTLLARQKLRYQHVTNADVSELIGDVAGRLLVSARPNRSTLNFKASTDFGHPEHAGELIVFITWLRMQRKRRWRFMKTIRHTLATREMSAGRPHLSSPSGSNQCFKLRTCSQSDRLFASISC